MAEQTYPYQPDYATPPGYVLEDHLEAKGLTPDEFAKRHSLATGLIEGVIAGNAPIDEELAALFGREFSLEERLWLRMEADYRRRLKQGTSVSHLEGVKTMDTSTVKRIVCLANSRKPGGRCIAGKDILGNGQIGHWIRPVSHRDTEEVSKWERQYADGSDPRLLDVIDVPLINANPRGYQQENWRIDPQRNWEKVRTATGSELEQCISPVSSLWVDGYKTINGMNDRVPLQISRSLTDSLRFIEVGNLELSVRSGGTRVQGCFQYYGTDYWLQVTDPVCEKEYKGRPDGNYPIGRCYLTVSLGTPFKGYAYKLIAAIIKP